jgi:translation initiation factor 3 subunit J
MSWDDSDDDWDKSDDEIDARLGLTPATTTATTTAKSAFDDEEEEDLAIIEKARQDSIQHEALRSKGKKLAGKKAAEQEAKEEEELVRKAMELEAEMEEKLTIDEKRELERKRIEEADNALTDDLFGAVEGVRSGPVASKGGMEAGDTVKMKDLKDHLKHARKVAQCLKVSVFCCL